MSGIRPSCSRLPKSERITLAEWDAVKEDVVEEETEESVETPEEEEEEVIAKADEGEMLVLRRALIERKIRTSSEKIFFTHVVQCREKCARSLSTVAAVRMLCLWA